MIRPMELGTSRDPRSIAGECICTGEADAAACTSAARISPSGPDPRRVARSTPRSLARRRALGEIFAVVDDFCANPITAVVTGCWIISTWDPARAEGVAEGLSAGGASPGATIHAIV